MVVKVSSLLYHVLYCIMFVIVNNRSMVSPGARKPSVDEGIKSTALLCSFFLLFLLCVYYVDPVITFLVALLRARTTKQRAFALKKTGGTSIKIIS